MTLSGQFFTTM